MISFAVGFFGPPLKVLTASRENQLPPIPPTTWGNNMMGFCMFARYACLPRRSVDPWLTLPLVTSWEAALGLVFLQFVTLSS